MFLPIYWEFAKLSERNFEVGRLAVSVSSKLLQIFVVSVPSKLLQIHTLPCTPLLS